VWAIVRDEAPSEPAGISGCGWLGVGTGGLGRIDRIDWAWSIRSWAVFGDSVAWYINAFYDNNHIHIHISRPYSLYLSATKTGPGSNLVQTVYWTMQMNKTQREGERLDYRLFFHSRVNVMD
jgi:hypothetical protein